MSNGDNSDLLENSMEMKESQFESSKSLFFDDGKRKIDFVLVFENDPDEEEEDRERKERKRKTFLKNLEVTGLAMEEAVSTSGKKDEYGTFSKEDPSTHFVKLHAPFNLLCETAEDMKMKMPIKENDIAIESFIVRKLRYVGKWIKEHDPLIVRDSETVRHKSYFVSVFDKERISDYINHDKEHLFFSEAERSRLVYYLCEQTRYGDADLDIGMRHLIHSGAIIDGFPLHDGNNKHENADAPQNQRQRLEHDWARPGRLFKYQPIDSIKEYFGEKVALYFAWLGFYTSFLVPASLIGLLCFLIGVATTFSFEPIKEICKPKSKIFYYMCPLCDELCQYYYLSTSCLYAKVTHFFDNGATLFFALFMSLWATFFLEFWKRKQITLAYEWHTMDFEEEEERPRPEYVATATTLKKNPVTAKMEPFVPASKRVPRIVGALGVVLFFIILVIGAVVGVIVYRGAIYAILIAQGNTLIRTRAKMVVAASAAVINLLTINILKFVYQRIAIMLTNWENPRTKTDYEDSFTIKMFWFQFVNTYASIFYVAFFKNEYFVGWPGSYKRFSSSAFRLEGCSAQGCFLELCIQLIIIMFGQQVIGNISEIALPWLMKKFRGLSRRGNYEVAIPQWEKDYELKPQDEFSLFWQYLEIVLQYGFVTMFVAAFPLAPLLALLNNLAEIRLDGINFIRNFRRPVAERAEDIGAWYGILATLTTLSVLVNAFVIAFTSEFIPRLVYEHVYSGDGSLEGYVNNSMSFFQIIPGKGPATNATFCRFPGYHEKVTTHLNDLNKTEIHYPFNKQYYLVLSARLAFVFIFQVVVNVITNGIGLAIPDIPETLSLKIKREAFLASEATKDHKEKTGKRKPRKRRTVADEKPASQSFHAHTEMV